MNKYFLSTLGLIFIVLKLTHVIAWSWWLVTLPLWGLLALVCLIAFAAALGLAIKASLG